MVIKWLGLAGGLAAICLLILTGGCENVRSESCEVDTSGYETARWAAPEVAPEQPALQAATGSTLYSSYWFGPNVHSTLATLWWPSEGDTPFVFSYSAGPSSAGIRDGRAVLIVDGLQRPLLDASGQRVNNLSVKVAPGEVGAVTAAIPEDTFTEGSHTMVASVIDSQLGFLETGFVWTVIKGRAQFAARPDHTTRTVLGHRSDLDYIQSDEKNLSGPISTIHDDGTLPLRFLAQTPGGTGCRDRGVPVVTTVLVDFEQAQLDGFGPFVRVLVKRHEGALVETAIHGLVRDGNHHVLTVLTYDGDGWYNEAPPGHYLPWSGLPTALANGYYN